jgi:integrase
VLAAPIIYSKLAEWDEIRKRHASGLGFGAPTVVPSYLTGAAPGTPDEIVFSKTALTPQLIKNIVAVRAHSWVAQDDEERDQYSDEEFAEIVEFSQMSEAELRKFIARGANPKNRSDLVEEVLETGEMLRIKIDTMDPLFHQLVREFAIAEVKVHQLFNQRNRGEWVDPEQYLPKVGTQLTTMVEIYREHKLKEAGVHYVSTGISVWERFIEFKGNVFLGEVSSRDVYEFMNHHLTVSKRWSQQYLSKVKVYLTDIFSVAITLNHFDGQNPVDNLARMPQLPKAERALRAKPRYPLSTEQINTIFSSEWYDPNSKRWKGQLGNDLGTRYFMPIILVLHGSRVREPLQLMTDDIIIKDDIVCFNFRLEFGKGESDENDGINKQETTKKHPDDLPARSFKNDDVIRIIPVHRKLLELGFMQYVEERRAALGHPGPLFQSALPEPGGKAPKYGRVYEQGMLRFMRDVLKFPSGYGNHSNRHQLEDRIREANAHLPWPAGMWQFLTGRRMPAVQHQHLAAPVGSEQDYGLGYSPAAVSKWQFTIGFSDIVFPLPYALWRASKR